MGQSTGVYRLPSSEQIGKAAYERWARRGYSHGSDREDWLAAESELTFQLNYRTIAREEITSSDSTLSGRGPRRVCRFCEQAAPRVRFSPQRLAEIGSPGPFVSARPDVCDECLQGFRDSLEPDLDDFWRSLPSRFEGGHAEMELPLGVFKALTWMALALMPDRELELFPDALEWVSNPDHAIDANLFGGLQCLAYRLPELDGQKWASLESRRDEDSALPSVLLFLTSGPFVLQSAVPLGILDQDLDDALPLLGRWWTSPGRPDLGSCRLLTPPRGKRATRSRLGA